MATKPKSSTQPGEEAPTFLQATSIRRYLAGSQWPTPCIRSVPHSSLTSRTACLLSCAAEPCDSAAQTACAIRRVTSIIAAYAEANVLATEAILGDKEPCQPICHRTVYCPGAGHRGSEHTRCASRLRHFRAARCGLGVSIAARAGLLAGAAPYGAASRARRFFCLLSGRDARFCTLAADLDGYLC